MPSKRPGRRFLPTHANCRVLVPGSARCKTDEAITRLAAKGGVMGITMVRAFVGATRRVTIQNVLDHIDHLAKLVGVEHVGIGSDVDLDGRDPRGSAHQEIRSGWNRLCQENLRSDRGLGEPELFQPKHRTHSRRQFRACAFWDLDRPIPRLASRWTAINDSPPANRWLVRFSDSTRMHR